MAICLVSLPALVFAVYGMNFRRSPSYALAGGPPMAVLLALALDGALWLAFRRQGWVWALQLRVGAGRGRPPGDASAGCAGRGPRSPAPPSAAVRMGKSPPDAVLQRHAGPPVGRRPGPVRALPAGAGAPSGRVRRPYRKPARKASPAPQAVDDLHLPLPILVRLHGPPGPAPPPSPPPGCATSPAPCGWSSAPPADRTAPARPAPGRPLRFRRRSAAPRRGRRGRPPGAPAPGRPHAPAGASTACSGSWGRRRPTPRRPAAARIACRVASRQPALRAGGDPGDEEEAHLVELRARRSPPGAGGRRRSWRGRTAPPRPGAPPLFQEVGPAAGVRVVVPHDVVGDDAVLAPFAAKVATEGVAGQAGDPGAPRPTSAPRRARPTAVLSSAPPGCISRAVAISRRPKPGGRGGPSPPRSRPGATATPWGGQCTTHHRERRERPPLLAREQGARRLRAWRRRVKLALGVAREECPGACSCWRPSPPPPWCRSRRRGAGSRCTARRR